MLRLHMVLIGDPFGPETFTGLPLAIAKWLRLLKIWAPGSSSISVPMEIVSGLIF